MPLGDTQAYAPFAHLRQPGRDPVRMLADARAQWHAHRGQQADLWVFGYASLIWRPDFDFSERHATLVHGWHRALAMWSRVNRGTPEVPGLVFALLPGGSCQGMVFRIPRAQAEAVFDSLWAREMPSAVYDPRWLPCFRLAHGRYGSTLDYARQTHASLQAHGLHDRRLGALLRHAEDEPGASPSAPG